MIQKNKEQYSEFTVTKIAERPANPTPVCFYCDQPVGDKHKKECVLIHKKVVVKATIEYEIEVPNFWTAEDIEFHRNESSWCSNNIIEELEDTRRKLGCLCECIEFEFVRETEEKNYLRE